MVKHKVATGLILWCMMKLGLHGWTSLWDTIYYAKADYMVRPDLIAHERCHINQMNRDGKFTFMVKYCYYLLRYGYKDNPYEVEARNVADRNTAA